MMRIFYAFLFILCAYLLFYFISVQSTSLSIPMYSVTKKNFSIDIQVVGELEAAESISISSSIKGDQGKIINIVPDGTYVEPGQILIQLDPTPFEEKIEKLSIQIREQEAYNESLKQSHDWNILQAKHKNENAQFEREAAKLELEKIVHGDGPQEIARLKSAMQKTFLKLEDLQAYSQDLDDLATQGLLNGTELKIIQKKLRDETETYETAKHQYENYIEHVLPMQIKKGETAIRRADVAAEEIANANVYQICKSKNLLEDSILSLELLLLQLQEAENELEQSSIRAPAAGMVVLREEYHSGQRRKARVGDVLIKNQPVIDLPNLHAMIVMTRVREIDLHKIAVGNHATVEVDAYPQSSFKGRIISIGVLAVADKSSKIEDKYFQIRIVLHENDPRLRPGMTAHAFIHAKEIADSLAIPVHAVFTDDDQPYCYVSHSGEPSKRKITVGMSNEQWAEVQSGLLEGESICLIP
jgi:HlyD family secretion protein